MKKAIALLLMLVMAVSMSTALAETYAASAKGFGGDVIVNLTVENGVLTAVTAEGAGETAGIGSNALEKMPAQMVALNTIEADAVAGATLTSNAILSAAAQALSQAGMTAADLTAVAASSVAAEDVEMNCDVLVIGAGYAGMAAAHAAAAEGANVVLIEKLGMIGGTSAMSGGETFSDGKAESIPELYTYWTERQNDFRDADMMDKEKVAFYLNELPTTLIWLSEEFGMLYNDEGIKSNPVRRPTLVEGKGAGVAALLGDKIEENGIKLMLNTAAEELITDEANKVIGVKAAGENGETLTISAKAVVLATGSFTKNAELMKKYAPEYADFIVSSGAGDDGDGLLMAQKIGAFVFDDAVCVNNYGAIKADGSTMRATSSACLFVGMDGMRKCSEAEDRYYVSTIYLDVKEGPDFFSITDEQNAANNGLLEAIEANLEEASIIKADTLEDLAKQMGVDEDAFVATVARYNELCAAGEDADFGKAAKNMIAIENAPFYAVRNSEVIYCAMGGLKTDLNGAVLNTEGKAIEGLYAAGAICSRDMYGKLYIGASMVANALNGGRLTGINAAQAAK